MPQQQQSQKKSQVQMGITTMKRTYHAGHLGAQAASVKPDWDRGWSVARQSLVRNEAASAASQGLMETSRRWQIWSEVVNAMDRKDAEERGKPGCCAKMVYWFQNFFSLFEFFFRFCWHTGFAAFWGLLYLCMKKNPTVLANLGYHGMALGAYIASLGVMWFNVTNPGRPAYKFGGYSKFDKPVPPLASGDHSAKFDKQQPETGDLAREEIKPRGLVQNMVFVMRSKHPLQHLERFFKHLFCCFSCCASLHPGTTCGPCCMCTRSCYDTLPQRVSNWNEKIQKKRDPHLLKFYQDTFKCNSYEEYVQRRLPELAAAAPAPELAMQRGADVKDLEEGIALGVLEAFVGRGGAAGEASEPARAALGVLKGVIGAAPASGSEAELAGAQRGEQMSLPLQQALAMVKTLVGDLTQEAQQYKGETQQAVAHLQAPREETKEGESMV